MEPFNDIGGDDLAIVERGERGTAVSGEGKGGWIGSLKTSEEIELGEGEGNGCMRESVGRSNSSRNMWIEKEVKWRERELYR